jgi:uncharacterized membrane protein
MPTFNRSFNGGGSRAVVTDLEVDPSDSTVSVDETNNRLGIGTTTPGTQLELDGETPYITLKNSTAENTDGGCETKLIFEDHAAASLGQIEVNHSGSADDTKGKMVLSTHTGSSLTAAVTIDEAQKVTAAGDVQVTGDIILDDGGSLKEAGGTEAFTFDGSGNVTKIGVDSATNGQFLKYNGTKWLAATVSGTVAGSVAADDITTGDAAINLATSSGNITIDAQAGDADIIFKGTDDSSDITALTLDMSEAGAASFNGAVTVGADLTVTGGDTTLGAAGDTTATTISTVTNTGTTVGKSLTISAGSTTTGSNNLNGGDLILASGGGDGTGTSSIQFKTKIANTDASAERMRIHTDGNVGIGTNAPGNMLHVAGADAYVLLQNTTDENGDGQAETRLQFADHAGNGLAQIEGSHSGSSDDDKGKLIFSTNNDSGLQTALTIDDTQAATFAGNATFGVDDTGVDVRIFSATASEGVLYDASQDELGLLLTTKLKFHDIGGGEEIFASADGHLEVNAGTTLDMTAPTVDINASTAITMDSPGVTIASATSQKPVLTVKNETNDNNDPATILLLKSRAGNAGVDADKIGDFIFAGFNNAGTPEQIEFARIKAVIAERDDGAEGGELRLQVASHDGELKSGIKIIDGNAEDEVDVTIGSTSTSLTTVEGTMLVDGGTVQFGKGQNAVFAVETTDASTDGRDLTISAGSAPTGSANQNGGDLVLAAGGGDGNGTSIMTFATKTAAADTVAERMRIHTDGNVGIGTNAPSTLLHVAGQQPYLALQNTTDEHTDGGGESNIIFGDHTGQTLALIQGSHSGSSDNDKGKLVLSTNNDSGTQTALTIDDTQKSTFSGQAVVNNRFAAAGPSGTFVTFADGDATPSVATGNLFKHHASSQTITMFDDGIAGQVITVISTAAITYDVTSTNLIGGSTDIVTANGDVTQWAYDGTNWYLMQFMDVSADHSTVGGGGTAANDVNLILHTQVFGR